MVVAVVSIVNEVFEQKVYEEIQAEAKKFPEFTRPSPSSALQAVQYRGDLDVDEESVPGTNTPAPNDGLNRQDRRFRNKYLDKKNKN